MKTADKSDIVGWLKGIRPRLVDEAHKGDASMINDLCRSASVALGDKISAYRMKNALRQLKGDPGAKSRGWHNRPEAAAQFQREEAAIQKFLSRMGVRAVQRAANDIKTMRKHVCEACSTPDVSEYRFKKMVDTFLNAHPTQGVVLGESLGDGPLAEANGGRTIADRLRALEQGLVIVMNELGITRVDV